mmetsp:Transcript_12159/g.14138  ORF Transcript_12159/g.14138 Transcript_12159/m.14138 type:complete len:711 (+) Transcript_12159:185-2317(+)
MENTSNSNRIWHPGCQRRLSTYANNIISSSLSSCSSSLSSTSLCRARNSSFTSPASISSSPLSSSLECCTNQKSSRKMKRRDLSKRIFISAATVLLVATTAVTNAFVVPINDLSMHRIQQHSHPYTHSHSYTHPYTHPYTHTHTHQTPSLHLIGTAGPTSSKSTTTSSTVFRRKVTGPFINSHPSLLGPEVSPSSATSTSLYASSSSSSSPSSSPSKRHKTKRVSWSKRAYTRISSSASSSTSTSLPSRTRRKESKYGVRRRVRSVLEKAKIRTGIRNSSEELLNGIVYDDDDDDDDEKQEDYGTSLVVKKEEKFEKKEQKRPLKTTSSVPNVIAETVSIGGLGAVLIDETSGTIDVALDYVPPPPSDDEEEEDDDDDEDDIKDDLNQVMKENDERKDINGKLTPTSIQTTTSTDTVKQKKTTTSPASTYSKPIVRPLKPQPEDILVPAKPATSTTTSATNNIPRTNNTLTVVDAFKGDVSAAFSVPPPPLPFTLPKLSKSQNAELLNGERVQYQSDMGREGSGYIAVDVKAPASVVWECLLDFYSYPQTIPTVRDVQMFTNTHLKQDYYSEKAVERLKYEDGTLATLKHGVPSVTRAAFTLSKFRLKIAAIHKYRPHPQGDYMVFTLDPACTNVVLQNAKGVWHTQSNPDGRGEEYTRVWLLCELKVSSLLPKWIVDYAARKAMPRASSWIKPHCEAAADLWFKDMKER